MLRACSLCLLTFAGACPAQDDAKPDLGSSPGDVTDWTGTLDVGGVELRIVVHLTRTESGLTATMDSPDQGATGLPVTSAKVDDGTLALELKNLGASYDGTWDAGKRAFVGEWQQGGASLPLTLRAGKPAEVRRPQEPKPPFPYASEEVTFDSLAEDVTLAGTLTRPEGDGPFPAVVLVSGSGPQDRNEELFGHKPFLVLADHLTRRGIAVLRYDDRGVGDSTGDRSEAVMADFAQDAAGAVSYLADRKDIDAKRIGLAGHSEGGVVVPMVANAHPDRVAFLVLMAGTAVPGEELLHMQTAAVLKAMGVDKDTIAQGEAGNRKVYEAVRDAEQPLTDEQVAELVAGIAGGESEEARDTLKARLKLVQSRWFRDFLLYDPRPALTKVRCPVLAVFGGKDLQVPAEENAAGMKGAFAENGNGDVTVRTLPGLNHLFQTADSGAPTEYGRIEETFAPAALQVIGDWIEQQVK